MVMKNHLEQEDGSGIFNGPSRFVGAHKTKRCCMWATYFKEKQQYGGRLSGNSLRGNLDLLWQFDDRFFPNSMKQQKAREFANLVQRDRIVEQYARKFIKFGRFARHLIATEEMRTERFQEGLRQQIRRQVAFLQIQNN